jgi:hypothetical protein
MDYPLKPKKRNPKKVAREIARIMGSEGSASSGDYNDESWLRSIGIKKEPPEWKDKLDYWAEFWASHYNLEPKRVKAVYYRCDAI